MLKLVGYWVGEHDDAEWLHPASFVDPRWHRPDREKVVTYLGSGVRVHEYLGLSHCRFARGPPNREMGNSELTDGTFLWPEGLWIYVEKFDVRLPEELFLHMRQNGFRVNCEVAPEVLESESVDFEFWRRWCRENSRT